MYDIDINGIPDRSDFPADYEYGDATFDHDYYDEDVPCPTLICDGDE